MRKLIPRVLRSISVPLLSLLSLLGNHAVDAATTPVFGENGVSNPMMTWTGGAVRCSNNVVRFEWVISQTDSSMNGASHQPMAESGLPIVVLTFNSNILSVANSAPQPSVASGNTLTQPTQDDGPNVVQELTFSGIDCTNFQTIMYSMSASCPATGTTSPALAFPIKGTVGFSATPVTVVATPTSAAGTTGTTGGAVKFGETGVTNPRMTWTGGAVRCTNNNVVRFEWVISQTDSSMNGASHQPMAESGLPIVTLSFNHIITSVAQSAPVAATFSGNTLTQPTQDDGPNVVQELTFIGIDCTNFMSVQYSMNATCPATGTTAPKLPFPIKGTNGFSATPVIVVASPTTAAGSLAAMFGENMVTNPVMTWTGGAVRCSNNVVRFEWVISQTDSSMNGNAHQPMAESGLPIVVLSFNHNILSVANSAPQPSTFSGNTLTQPTQDDGPNVVQELTFQGVDCTNFQTIVYSMNASCPASRTTAPLLPFPIKGTNGFSATPVTVGTTGTATNAPTNAATNAPTNAPTNTGTATKAPTNAPTAPPAATGTGATKFGETGVTNPVMTWTGGPKSCANNNVVRFEWVISQTDSSMNGNAHQPMAESGLPIVVLSFNHNILTVAQSAPVAATISGNKLTQPTKDDGPNVVQELTFDGGVTCANFMNAVVYSMSASAPATGTTAPLLPFPIKGTVGFSATPVTVGQAAGGATTTTSAPTTATTATSAPTTATNTGGAASTAQHQVKLAQGLGGCWSNGSNAPANAIFQFMVQESNDAGNTFSQPMAEIGLPTITVTFNAPVTFIGTVFNVGNSQVSGKTWTFTLLDDQPNVGVGLQFAEITCVNGQFGQSLSYQVSAQQNGVQFGVIGTDAKGFMASNVAMPTPAPMPTVAPTTPTTAINKNTFGTTMVTNVVQTFTQSGNCWNNAKGAQAELLFNIAQTDSSSPLTPHAPTGETGIPIVTITFSSPMTVPGTFNVANSASTGSAWVFTEMDDQPVIGGFFQFTTAVQCINNQLSVNGQQVTFTISAKVGTAIFPTTSTSAAFRSLGAENSLDDGSAVASMSAGTTTSGSKSSSLVGVIAGVVAGLVVLTIVVVLLIRSRRRSSSPSAQPKVAWYMGKDTATADDKV